MSNQEVKKIILVYPYEYLIDRILKSLDLGSQVSWIYCGRDVSSCKKMECFIHSRAERLSIGPLLQETAETYRQEYIDYVGRLNAQNHSLIWWTTSISEKNPYVSNIFLNFCYIKVCLQLLRGTKSTIIVICENRSIFLDLKDNLGGKSSTFADGDEPFWIQIDEKVSYWLLPWARKTHFLLKYLTRIFFAKTLLTTQQKKISLENRPLSIIHSWTDIRSFSNDESYSSIYFGNLPRRIADLGHHPVFLIDILPTMSYLGAIKRLSKVKDDFLVLEQFLHFTDIFSTIFLFAKKWPTLSVIPDLDGISVTNVVQDELNRDHTTVHSVQAYLNYIVSQRLAELYSIQEFVFAFENHAWEKMFCAGFKEFSPATKRLGIIHSIVNKMYTSYSKSDYEERVIPSPTIILANGEHSQKMLVRSGFNNNEIALVGSFRHSALYNPKEASCMNPSVLVALSAGVNESLELIDKTVSALKECKNMKIIFKCHPTIPSNLFFLSHQYKQYKRYVENIPKNFSFSDEPISNLLDQCCILLYTESTACLEAIFRGISVVHVKSDYWIDMNVLDGVDIVESVASPSEIRNAVVKSLHERQVNYSDYYQLGLQYFKPVDDSVVQNLFS